MTTEALSGEVKKKGISGRDYVFGFGWSCRYNLEEVYGLGLKNIGDEADQAALIANVLLAALRTREANNIPDTFSKKDLYKLMDDLGETNAIDIWNAAKHSLGFLNRLLGINDELVAELAAEATKRLSEKQSQSQPTGTDSSS